jgi:hypothetical protein
LVVLLLLLRQARVFFGARAPLSLSLPSLPYLSVSY